MSIMLSSPLRNLTGQVSKTQANNFAIGGQADIWMGELSQGHSKQTVRRILIRKIFLASYLHCQVAVKVVRDISNRPQHFEQLKIVSRSTITYSVLIRPQKLLREAKLWSQLNHPYVTPLYGICFDLGPPSAPCLICPYFKNGNVAKYLEKNPNADRMGLVIVSMLEYQQYLTSCSTRRFPK